MSDYNSGLCGCLDDCGVCCYGWCCLPCLIGDNMSKADGSSCVVWCCVSSFCPHLGLYQSRVAVQAKAGIHRDTCNNCCTICCCPLCSVTLDARELKSRGIITSQP